MSDRRSFLKQLGTGALLAGMSAWSMPVHSASGRQLIILHTNDVHSHLEPFPDNHPQFPGMGGVAARKALIQQIRSEGHPVLLLDAGDMFQGTPYFNFFMGEPEIKSMNLMGYDAVTFGNHDFDGGIENLAEQSSKATFAIVCSNYIFHNIVLNKIVKPYHVIHRGGLKIGIIGLGIDLKGLVPEKLFEGTVYKNPLESAISTADFLKIKKRCDLVIALSHLGYQYSDDRISDVKIAENARNIDIIIGGHTHTFMEQPDIRYNTEGEKVMIHQAGWAGVRLGRINVDFEKSLNKNHLSTNTVVVDKKSIAF